LSLFVMSCVSFAGAVPNVLYAHSL